MKYFSSRHGFTLIELLVVISIIGILAGLSFTGVNGALNTARRTTAKNDVIQIANSILAYEGEYGKLPPCADTNAGAKDVDGTLMKALTGEDTNANPRKILFIEVSAAKNKRSGTNENGIFVDPWSNSYRMALDFQYDNKVDVGEVGGPTNATIRKRVGVWNKTNENCRIPVSSWE